MSYTFNPASSQYAYRTASVPVTGQSTFTFLAWVKITDSAIDKHIFALSELAHGHQDYVKLAQNGDDYFAYGHRDSVVDGSYFNNCGAMGGSGKEYDTWHLIGLRKNADDTLEGFLNGTWGGAAVAACEPYYACDQLRIGATWVPDKYLYGKIAYAAFHSAALSNSDFTALLTADPRTHSTASSRIACWDLTSAHSAGSFADSVGSYTLTTSGSPAYDADNPTVFGTPTVTMGRCIYILP